MFPSKDLIPVVPSTLVYLIVDGTRLLDLIVPVRKVPIRNRALATLTDVKNLSQKHGFNAPKVQFPLTSVTQPTFPGSHWLEIFAEITGHPNDIDVPCGTFCQNRKLYSKFRMLL